MKDIVKKTPAVVAEQQAEENNIISYSFSCKEIKEALRKTREIKEVTLNLFRQDPFPFTT